MKICNITKKNFWFIVIVILLIVFCAISLFKELRIEFFSAKNEEYHDIVLSSGTIVRDEEVLKVDVSETLNRLVFYYADGEKVPKDSKIATIYGSAKDAEKIYKLQVLEHEMKNFEKESSLICNSSESIDNLNHKINVSIEEILTLGLNSDFSRLSRAKKNLSYFLNKKCIALGKNSNFKSEVVNIKKSIDDLSYACPRAIEDIYVPYAGRFVRCTDGFENSVNCNSILNNKNFSNINPTSYDFVPIGKIVKSETWYAVFNISESEAHKIKKASSLNLSTLESDAIKNVPARVEALNPSGETYILILSCDKMDQSIACLRKEKFVIELGVYSGIKIDKCALHQEKLNSSFGVYVKYGNYLKFKNVDILFANSDFVICDYNFDHYNNENYLQPSDKVAYKGKRLFDGKHI